MAMFSIDFKHLKREESTREKKSEKELRIKQKKRNYKKQAEAWW